MEVTVEDVETEYIEWTGEEFLVIVLLYGPPATDWRGAGSINPLQVRDLERALHPTGTAYREQFFEIVLASEGVTVEIEVVDGIEAVIVQDGTVKSK